MSRPKSIKSKSRSKTPSSTAKHTGEPASAAKVASSDPTPDECGKTEHRAEAHKESPVEGEPWSEWQWCEEGQMCYRGRKDSKGEWEYDYAPLPKEKERPYTPPRAEPIEYLIEEWKVIWEPRPIEIPIGYSGTATAAAAATDKTPKRADEVVANPAKVDFAVKEDKEVKDEEEETSEKEEKQASAAPAKKLEKHEKHDKPRKERPVEKRGRQLERKHFNQKEKKDKVDRWRKDLE